MSMTLFPGFRAEASLYKSHASYGATIALGEAAQVVPARISVGEVLGCGAATVGAVAACAGTAGIGCWAAGMGASVACGIPASEAADWVAERFL